MGQLKELFGIDLIMVVYETDQMSFKDFCEQAGIEKKGTYK